MFKYLRYVFTIGPRLLFDWVFYLYRYARHPEKYPLEVRYHRVRSLILFVLKKMRLDIKAFGYQEYLKRKGPRLYVVNHLSDMDPLFLIALSPEPLSFVAKKETESFPVIGLALRCLDGFFLDRSDLMQSAKILRACGERLKKGDLSYCIFPEGTRNKEPSAPLLPFHPGSYKAALWSKVPVEEIAIYGTFRVLSTHYDEKRQPLFVSFLGTHECLPNTVDEAAESEKRIGEEVKRLRDLDTEYFADKKEKRSLRGLPVLYIHERF